jgi:hypothetical protein
MTRVRGAAVLAAAMTLVFVAGCSGSGSPAAVPGVESRT